MSDRDPAEVRARDLEAALLDAHEALLGALALKPKGMRETVREVAEKILLLLDEIQDARDDADERAA